MGKLYSRNSLTAFINLPTSSNLLPISTLTVFKFHFYFHTDQNSIKFSEGHSLECFWSPVHSPFSIPFDFTVDPTELLHRSFGHGKTAVCFAYFLFIAPFCSFFQSSCNLDFCVPCDTMCA